MFGKKKNNAEKAVKPESKTESSAASTTSTSTSTSTVSSSGIPKREQEIRREARFKEQEERRLRMMEEQKAKKEKERALKEEMKKRQRLSMITFCIGLVVMVTALICLFPTTEIIIFSTLLMFTFFFLGVAYQRLVMQLLVLALTCMLITGAFYTIMLNS